MDVLISSLESIRVPTGMQQDWTEEYQQPYRFYHNLNHIRHMLTAFAEHCWYLKENHGELIAAIWLHDIVYDPKASDNEERSAAIAGRDLSKCVTQLGEKSSLDISLVTHLILNTKHHQGGTPLLDLFCDLDLFILGETRGKYTRYLEGIRKEYSFVPAKDYIMARTKILQKFDDENIFKTKAFGQYEDQAHRNLKFEINLLHDEQNALN